jgi:hypothetical protein
MTLNGNNSTVKSLLASTADVQSLLHARLNGNGHVRANGGNGHKARRSHYSHFRDGYRLAAMRAYAAVVFAAEHGIGLDEAALWTGSNPVYARALAVIVKSKDTALLNAVLKGCAPVPAAAASVKGLAKLLAAFADTTPENKAAFGRTVGTDILFDTVLVPAMEPPKTTVPVGVFNLVIKPTTAETAAEVLEAAE